MGSVRRACTRLQRVRRGQESLAGSSQERRSQGQAFFPARFRRPDGTITSRGPRGLQVHHKYFGRVHQVNGGLLAEAQAQRSQLIPGIRTICGDSKRFPR